MIMAYSKVDIMTQRWVSVACRQVDNVCKCHKNRCTWKSHASIIYVDIWSYSLYPFTRSTDLFPNIVN